MTLDFETIDEFDKFSARHVKLTVKIIFLIEVGDVDQRNKLLLLLYLPLVLDVSEIYIELHFTQSRMPAQVAYCLLFGELVGILQLGV
jgi:hypothetical protein